MKEDYLSWNEASQECKNFKLEFPVFSNATIGLANIRGAYDNSYIFSIFGSDLAGRVGRNGFIISGPQ